MIALLKQVYKHRTSYLFIAPFYAMFLLFTVFPILWALRMSFFEMPSVTEPPTFVGVQHFVDLVNERFIKGIVNTFYYTGVQVPTMMIMALILGLLLNLKIRMRNAFRYVYFLPVTCSLVVAAMIFIMIYERHAGALNLFLRTLGLDFLVHDWLNEPGTAMPAIIMVANWRWTGYQMVVILAGLQAINPELYEAARVDGANSWQVIRRITIPLLYPVLFFIATMSVIGSLRMFSEPYILTDISGPLNSTLTMVGYLFTQGFRYYKLGFASAVGWAITLITAVISWFFMKYLSGRAGFT